MPLIRIIAATAITAALYLATDAVWAQGGSEMLRSQGSNPSATANRLQGLPPQRAGAPGNLTGNPMGNPMGSPGTQGTENRPASPGRSQPPPPTN